MYKCKTLQDYIKGFGMEVSKDGNDIQSMISFIGVFGNQTTFAPMLYQFYENEAIALDDDDLTFIEEVNNYYKEMYGLPYDVLIVPEGESDKFDKNIMRDLNKPNEPFMRFSEVYTPAIMRDQRNVEKRMIVKGE